MDKTDPLREASRTALPNAVERGLPFMLVMAIAVGIVAGITTVTWWWQTARSSCILNTA